MSITWEPFLTCAITGAGDTASKHPDLPITPEQIATSAIEAAQAGAAVVHIHVREPSTGKGSRKPEYFREVVERIRDSKVDVVLNLTTGMGGDLVVGQDGMNDTPQPGTDCVGPIERLQHVIQRRFSQVQYGRKALHPAFEVGDYTGHLCLLKHDLGDPDGIRRAIAAPGQIAAPGRDPAEQRQSNGYSDWGEVGGHKDSD